MESRGCLTHPAPFCFSLNNVGLLNNIVFEERIPQFIKFENH